MCLNYIITFPLKIRTWSPSTWKCAIRRVLRNELGLDKRNVSSVCIDPIEKRLNACFSCFAVSGCRCSFSPLHLRSVVSDKKRFSTWNAQSAKLFHGLADWMGLVTYQQVTVGFLREVCYLLDSFHCRKLSGLRFRQVTAQKRCIFSSVLCSSQCCGERQSYYQFWMLPDSWWGLCSPPPLLPWRDSASAVRAVRPIAETSETDLSSAVNYASPPFSAESHIPLRALILSPQRLFLKKNDEIQSQRGKHRGLLI